MRLQVSVVCLVKVKLCIKFYVIYYILVKCRKDMVYQPFASSAILNPHNCSLFLLLSKYSELQKGIGVASLHILTT